MNEIESFPLPNGWVWTTVGAISKRIHYGYTARATKDKIGPKFLRITDVQNNWVNWATVPYCWIDTDQLQKYLLREGDIVFARTGATVGKSFLIQSVVPEAVFASYLLRIILPDCVHKRFLFSFFHSPLYWSQISRAKIGIGQPNVNAQILSRIVFPLAPRPEQWRIISKVEELFTKLDAGVNSLQTIKVQLKRYRQSVLKSAFEGKLTEEWRRTHRDELEPASKMLERIKEEQTNTTGKRKEHPPVDTSNLPGLPEGWVWTSVSDTVGIIDYRGRTPPFSSEGVPHLRSSNIRQGRILWDGLEHVSTEAYVEYMTRGLPEKGDLLFTTEAPLGEVALVPDSKFSVAQRIMILRPSKKILDSRFLLYQIMSDRFQARLKRRGTGTTVTGVSSRNFKPVELVFCSIAEQYRVVKEIERRLSVADEVEKTVVNGSRQAEKLRQSILKRAFEGKLVPQDPNDEPASVLLERIRSLKPQMIQDRKARKGRQHDAVQRRLS